MHRCGTCRHFVPAALTANRREAQCTSPRWRRGYESSALSPGEVQVENDEGWGFLVTAEFGCVHWTPAAEPGPWQEIAEVPLPTDGTWVAICSDWNPYYVTVVRVVDGVWQDAYDRDCADEMRRLGTHWAPLPERPIRVG